MALPLQDQQVATRFGELNFIPMQNLDEDEARIFIKALVSEWVDPGKREALMETFGRRPMERL